MKRLFGVPIVVIGLLLSGCFEDVGDDTVAASSGGGGGNCSGDYRDLISANEREAANACGTQVSTQFAAADAYLQAALEACRQGETAAANQYYSNYEQQVSHARTVAEGFNCTSGGGGGGGGGGTSFEDTSSTTYYNLCVGQTSTHIYAACYGPVQYSNSSCGSGGEVSYNYLRRYDSSAACTRARDDYLDNY
ncbi:hypothetical protein [Marinimicrobium alkaliphilum]|uniref:hypothetical protein n=1 Tax=Marinimicrobium alkaliphilum TaxID=2202654 RepID=UPI000DB950F1|nr:hypothetical protein [Marinimicrobium alkaliphilum]